MKEIWKDIKGYEGLYQVSNLGRVKRTMFKNCYVEKKQEKILKLKSDKDGYKQTTLFKNGKRMYFRVHRLVANAFLPNPNNYPIINHKDQNTSNNNVLNLEWCTFVYNNNYKNRNEKIRKKVNQYDLQGNFIKTWNSVRDAGIFAKVHPGNITRCCKCEIKSSGGYKWKYYKQDVSNSKEGSDENGNKTRFKISK